jgi:MFS family permease
MVIGFTTSLAFMVIGLSFVGISMGLMMPALSGQLMRSVSQATLGRTMGGFTSSIFLGQFLSPLVLQPVIGAMGMTGAFLGAGACATLAFVLVIGFLKRV